MILLQQNVCSSGHPALKEEGGEMFVVLILFGFQNLIEAQISLPEMEEYPVCVHDLYL